MSGHSKIFKVYFISKPHIAWCRINTISNKAIRDGKYLARHMPVLGNVHPIKIENVDIFFRDVISLLARVVILLIDTTQVFIVSVDRAYKEVSKKKYYKNFLCLSFCDMIVPSKSNVPSLWPWPLTYQSQFVNW